MSSGLITIILVIAVLLIVAYVTAVLLRKRNETLLAQLEERKEKLYNLPVNDEIEKIKNMHLIGQSQVSFREWNQKWVDLSLNSFADIENNIFEAEGFNNAFRFFKAQHAIENIESQLNLIDEDIKSIRQALVELEEQESKNSGRVIHALDLFEELQTKVADDVESYGKSLDEVRQQLGNIQTEFSQFVALNSSGDPVEASEILDKTEDHILALSHIVDRIPAIVAVLEKDLPDQLEDLESGYRKLLEDNYTFLETDIESRFQQLHQALTNNGKNVAVLELDNAQFENEQIQEEISALYEIFTLEINSRKKFDKLNKFLPGLLKHIKENNDNLQVEVERLGTTYVLSDLEVNSVRDLQTEITGLEGKVVNTLGDQSISTEPYSIRLEEFEGIETRMREIEEEQISLNESLARIELDDTNARQKVNIYINKLHTIKRYMEKRNLPGIPASFLSLFFAASHNTEALLSELEEKRVNMESVNRMLEIVVADMQDLEEETYQIVQNATLTEQLLQYSNRYRSFDQNVQHAFDRALDFFEQDFDYAASFEEIANAVEIVEPGVTERFVTSYEKTKENIRF
ncbi:Septation ring formation regulator EzrA [Streptococcus sp. DD10]|uniref:septation ring formation regulator EzrA n=1 Tax=Streptococcus sp. DD10 TaxID=1777878 RepID=UPI000796DDBE|nr:septation ring formation regulator EzrA [Streptococcus sp. DD10]KXT73671.1 Septation ring formation regulator EzrA [Streptococcus sp. DD10]